MRKTSAERQRTEDPDLFVGRRTREDVREIRRDREAYLPADWFPSDPDDETQEFIEIDRGAEEEEG